MCTLRSDLDDPAYHARVKMPGYNGTVQAHVAVSTSDAAKVLRKVKPAWTREDHARLAKCHEQAARQLRNEHSELLDQAALETLGRPFEITDYRISAVGCEEFSESFKQRLRFAAHAANDHEALARAHAWAAKRLRCG